MTLYSIGKPVPARQKHYLDVTKTFLKWIAEHRITTPTVFVYNTL